MILVGYYNLWISSKINFIKPYSVCSYDEENCNADDYEPFRVNGNGIPKNFTKPASPIKDFFGYQDGIESLIVRKGCEAVLYKSTDCESDAFTLKAETNNDLTIRMLSESNAKAYGKHQGAYKSFNPKHFYHIEEIMIFRSSIVIVIKSYPLTPPPH